MVLTLPRMSEVQVKVRMSVELHQQITDAAAANKRSATAEINARLEASFSAMAPSPADDWEQLRFLNHRKDRLQAKLLAAQGMQLRIFEEQRGARTAGLTPADMAELEEQALENRLDIYRINDELMRLLDELDKAYAKVDGKQPPGEMRITKAG